MVPGLSPLWPIQQEVAKRAYLEFVNAGLITPERNLDAGWDEL